MVLAKTKSDLEKKIVESEEDFEARMGRLMGQFAGMQVEQARHLQDIKADVATCASIEQHQELSRLVEQCVLKWEMRQLEKKMTPLI